MLRTVWAKIGGRKRQYLIDERYDFVAPVARLLFCALARRLRGRSA
ncbi:MAG TPA: hypothetical protein VJ124_16250 [Pyrinomonadaceae bacterium]|nr:hypothetical protein [Pyrinomonadaceae bacterium]